MSGSPIVFWLLAKIGKRRKMSNFFTAQGFDSKLNI
jgi:hypothetical protein